MIRLKILPEPFFWNVSSDFEQESIFVICSNKKEQVDRGCRLNFCRKRKILPDVASILNNFWDLSNL